MGALYNVSEALCSVLGLCSEATEKSFMEFRLDLVLVPHWRQKQCHPLTIAYYPLAIDAGGAIYIDVHCFQKIRGYLGLLVGAASCPLRRLVAACGRLVLRRQDDTIRTPAFCSIGGL